jgi:nuclear pore complex protein Nup93
VLIFYLIRCGLFQEAVTYVEENDRAIKNIDRNFHQYLRSYASNTNRRISRELQNMIQTEYQRRIRLSPENSIDPYRLACLKVLGRCELNKRNLDGLNQGVDDWVWLQFSLAREINRAEDAATESFGLDELRSTIAEIGQKHFSDRDKEGPAGSGVYFLLQMLGGMFEEAIFYLVQTNHVSAAHFAIALDFYGLLRVSDFATAGPEILSFTTTQKPQINFARMVGLYTMDFRQAKAEAACDYLTLICLNADLPGQAGQNHAEVCHEALRELVLETREFVQLIGDVRNDGKRIQGAIPQRMKLIKLATQDNFLKRVTQGAALIADNSGRTVDAVLLYFLAEDHSKVIDVTIRAVSDALAVELGQPTKLEPLKAKADGANAAPGVDDPSGSTLSSMSVDDPAALSTVISKIYMGNMNVKLRSSDQRALRTLELLYTMMLVRKNVEAGNWSRAIDVSFFFLQLTRAIPRTISPFLVPPSPLHIAAD